MLPSVLVLGIGNPFRGDDGVGPRVVEELTNRGLPERVTALDAGTAPPLPTPAELRLAAEALEREAGMESTRNRELCVDAASAARAWARWMEGSE